MSTEKTVRAIADISVDTSALLVRIREIWEAQRAQAARSVNTAHVCANWLIGQQIVEAEQGGTKRAAYGKALLQGVSAQLKQAYGDGFSVSALQYMRSFFLAYPALLAKQHAPRVKSDEPLDNWQPGFLHSGLSWTHYRRLLKEQRKPVRNFYEIESVNNGWSGRQLERQMNAFLFERLAQSRDPAGVLALASEGHVLLAEIRRELDVLDESFAVRGNDAEGEQA